MIIIQFQGGLGNQLFQYAAGRALSLESGQPLRLDLSWYRQAWPDTEPRTFILPSCLAVWGEASPADIARLSGLEPATFLDRFMASLGRPRPRLKRSHFRELPSSAAADELLRRRGETYLEGHWQDWRFLERHSSVIRDEITGSIQSDPADAALIDRLLAEDSICLHVRRGDYAKNAKTSAFHGLCKADYYQRALALLSFKAGAPLYAISDDPAWVSEELGFTGCTVLSRPGDPNPWRDLVLMSCCRHLIIANSTYSWWAAWMRQRSEATVVMPFHWFTNPHLDTSGLRPLSWLAT